MQISSKKLKYKFLNFFKKKEHKIIKSSTLIPLNDPTLMFINSGMAQFKDIFTGLEDKACNQAVSIQKCIRAGGKHNDLENVGITTRHHVFFEMLGNFSFGGYFKEKACIYAWEFLTKELKLNPDKISVTIFSGDENFPQDKETELIWKNVIGINTSKIIKKGSKDNFWSMGDHGPCGPCSEIHYDKGNANTFGDKDDANIELWNLVFMQYERKSDGTFIDLPVPCVDTGMGLERLSSVVNNLNSNYETDLLKPLINYCSIKSKKIYKNSNNSDCTSLRIIADHSRAISFIIADGVLPSNEGRGYVLRKIIRRAVYQCIKLELNKPFLYEVCNILIKKMSEFYPELSNASALIEKTVTQEEIFFRKTIKRGLDLFNKKISTLRKNEILDGSIIFKLHETYGFPSDLTSSLSSERGISINWDNFNKAKLNHEEKSRRNIAARETNNIFKEIRKKSGITKFIKKIEKNKYLSVIALIKNNKNVKTLINQESGIIILDQTDFYAESSGQIGDIGFLMNEKCKINVIDTKKILNLHCHMIKVKQGSVNIDDKLLSKICIKKHTDIKRNHSATHLLNAALRKVLGNHITQKGSLIDENRIRFDFSHFNQLEVEEISKIENLVNNWILDSCDTKTKNMQIIEAKRDGALFLFGEKYDDQVKVVSIGPNSLELCGGTHVVNTSNIGQFKILNDSSLSFGIRRIDAVTGLRAFQIFQDENNILTEISKLLLTSKNKLIVKIRNMTKEIKDYKKIINNYETKKIENKAKILSKNIKKIFGINILIEKIKPKKEANFMRIYADQLQNILGNNSIIVLGSIMNSKAMILIKISKNLTEKFNAKILINNLAIIIGGTGGGRIDLAQAGGSKYNKLDEALREIYKLIKNTQ